LPMVFQLKAGPLRRSTRFNCGELAPAVESPSRRLRGPRRNSFGRNELPALLEMAPLPVRKSLPGGKLGGSTLLDAMDFPALERSFAGNVSACFPSMFHGKHPCLGAKVPRGTPKSPGLEAGFDRYAANPRFVPKSPADCMHDERSSQLLNLNQISIYQQLNEDRCVFAPTPALRSLHPAAASPRSTENPGLPLRAGS
jgi:hypothetical protein